MNTFISVYHELKPEIIIIFSGCNDMNFEFEKNTKGLTFMICFKFLYVEVIKLEFLGKKFFKNYLKILGF